eukprot:CAMPEP_0172362782 /NCGR_PEP_ID=MMETSP1060-20121228/6319_1 /TAXON_ID=37318 /ORGANISM="Pseudo-nitzschia pungens, Strain cf. cingulata" /LENGTH=69 /DNA_ID=CAMNT_0013085365 /DNA_START=83 /DNA_END=289 /DNA_ORIENTATION=+
MGTNQSHPIPTTESNRTGEKTFPTEVGDGDGDGDGDGNNAGSGKKEIPIFPTPSGHEYDPIDKLQEELP